MWNGLMIDMYEDALTFNRNVVTLADWVGAVGGFLGSVGLVLGFLYPLLSPINQLETWLAHQLYKQQGENP
jgi:hypothetical protein